MPRCQNLTVLQPQYPSWMGWQHSGIINGAQAPGASFVYPAWACVLHMAGYPGLQQGLHCHPCHAICKLWRMQAQA